MNETAGKTILIVEDEAIVAIIEKKNLEQYGYKVITASSSARAVDLALNNMNIDLILMDINLGEDTDGTETAEIILEKRNLPIVFLSSHTEPEIVEKTEKITSYGYVVKNAGTTVLDASIKMAFKLFEANLVLSEKNDALHHHSQLLENIIENFPGFVLWKNPDSVFLGCNTNFARRCGFSSPSDIIGKKDYDLPFHKNEIEIFLADDREIMNSMTPKLHFEEREHIAGGEEIFLDTCKIPLVKPGGDVYGVLTVAMDITERKRWEVALANKTTELKAANEELTATLEEMEAANEELEISQSSLMENEIKLRESEKRLRAVLDATPFPVAIIDRADDKIFFWSRSAYQMFGHTAPTAAEWYKIAYPDPGYRNDVIARRKSFLEKMSGSGDFINTGEYNVTCKDGSIRICEVYTAFITGNLIVTFNDITGKKRAENEIRQTEEQLRILSNNIPHGYVYQVDSGINGEVRKFTYISDGVERIHGVKAADIMNDPMLLYGQFIEEDQKIVAEKETEALKTMSQFTSEIRYINPAGELRCSLFSSTPRLMPDNHLIWDGISIDITDQKLTREKLFETLSRLEEAQEVAKIGFWHLDLITGHLDWTKGIKIIFEIDPDGPAPSFNEFWNFVLPEDKDLVERETARLLQPLDPPECRYVYRIITPAGGIKHLSHIGKQIVNKDGKLLSIYGSVLDITDYKFFEEELVQKNEEITAAYEEMQAANEELEAVNDELVRSGRRLIESESSVRNKLRAILEPDGDISTLELSDIIDIEAIKAIMEDFYNLTGILGALLDVSGNVLVSVGWQDICTKFHRRNPVTLANCRESDTILSSGIQTGTFTAYRCKNNLWDMATPIFIAGKHIGNMFIGQFFYDDETPDENVFREQAKIYGFNEAEYINALRKVPHFSRETVNTAMSFYSKLAVIISTLSFSTIRLSKTIEENRRAAEIISTNERRFEQMIENSSDIIITLDAEGIQRYISSSVERILGYKPDELTDIPVIDLMIHPDDREHTLAAFNRIINEGGGGAQYRHRHKNGGWVYLEGWGTNQLGNPDIRGIVVNVRDITESKKAGEKIQKLLNEKEIILREVHHRVKNNMNSISGLLKLQAEMQDSGEIKNILLEAAGRIASMKHLYNRLYVTGNDRNVPVREYITPLADEIIRLFPLRTGITVRTEIDDITLDATITSTLGIILNEILTNSLKYAFTGYTKGEITVSMSKNSGILKVIIGDNGAGMPESVSFDNSSGFGLKLIEMLVDQMQGTVSIERGNGTRFVIELKI